MDSEELKKIKMREVEEKVVETISCMVMEMIPVSHQNERNFGC